jgi:DNA transformation protein and related proteins
MAVTESYLAYVLEQLAGLGRLRSRRMFGGVGLYADDLFFGLLDDNGLYFKVDDTTRGEFVARGMGQFRPFRDKPDMSLSYYEVPAEVIEDAEALVMWARKAVRVAAAAPRKAKSRRSGQPEASALPPGSPKAKPRGRKARTTR